MMKKLSVLFSLVVLAILCAFSANAGFLVDDKPYVEDAETKIVDHVVYKLQKDSKGKKYYEVYDWFDTYKASETVKEINIVSKIDGIKVTAINTYGIDEYRSDGYWKNKNYSVKKVTIPDTITEIGNYFFSVLDGVEELTIPASVKTIKNCSMYDDLRSKVFYEMENLKKVTFLGNLESLGGFENCKKLETVVLKGSVKNIRSHAFKNCVSLKNFQIPKSVESIGDSAFENTALTSVTIPAGTNLGHYDGYVFEGCKKLTKVVFTESKNSHISIRLKTFYNCTSLKTVEFPKSCENIYIEESAFENCSALKTVTFPKSCKNMTVGDRAFRNCKSLQAVKFPESCKKLTIGSKVFGNGVSIKTVTFPKTADSIIIGKRAFRNCQKISKVYNTTHIDKIYAEAFRNCYSLTSFTISDKTKTIGEKAFYNCKKLKAVTVNSTKTAPKIYKNAFYGTVNGIKFTAKNETAAKKWKSALKSSGLKNMKVCYVKYYYV